MYFVILALVGYQFEKCKVVFSVVILSSVFSNSSMSLDTRTSTWPNLCLFTSLVKPNYVNTPPIFMRFSATKTIKQYLSDHRTNMFLQIFPLENFIKKNHYFRRSGRTRKDMLQKTAPRTTDWLLGFTSLPPFWFFRLQQVALWLDFTLAN